MKIRFLLAAALAAMICLATAPDAKSWWRGGYHYSYHYGGYGGSDRYHYNSWSGGGYHGGTRGYNSYTGRYGGSRSYYNPYTGRYGSVQGHYNPYTNRYSYHYSYGDRW
jgi:hypothetical protein